MRLPGEAYKDIQVTRQVIPAPNENLPQPTECIYNGFTADGLCEQLNLTKEEDHAWLRIDAAKRRIELVGENPDDEATLRFYTDELKRILARQEELRLKANERRGDSLDAPKITLAEALREAQFVTGRRIELGEDSFGDTLELVSKEPLGKSEQVVPSYPTHVGENPSDNWSAEVWAVRFAGKDEVAAFVKYESSSSEASNPTREVPWVARGVSIELRDKHATDEGREIIKLLVDRDRFLGMPNSDAFLINAEEELKRLNKEAEECVFRSRY